MQSVRAHKLSCVPMTEIVESFRTSLKANFANSSVEIVECPDLRTQDWGIVSEGLGGCPRIADVGGVPNLIPTPNTHKEYNLDQVAAQCDLAGAAVIGPSAVASKLVGGNAELINNVRTSPDPSSDDHRTVKSYYSRVTDYEKVTYRCEPYPHHVLGLLGNLYLSRGAPGPVIKVTASVRTGTDNFVTCLNRGLGRDFKEPVGIGGVFKVTKGKVKGHVMPHFSCTPLESDKDVEKWLKFFEMNAPLVHTSVFVSKDPGLDLRLEHSHFFSYHGDGGHYHGDTTPGEVEYVGYFNLAEVIYRIDQPTITHLIGRD